MKLSHTAKSTYLDCPYKWNLHYNERLRSTKIGSALFFGGAIDEALNCLLLSKKAKPTKDEQVMMEVTPEETFKSSMQKVRIADEYIDISTSEKAEYYKSDLDMGILEAIDYNNIIGFAETQNVKLENMSDVHEFIEESQLNLKGLDLEIQRVYNYCCWLSLVRKGLMLIDTYNTEIMPQIEEVFEIQKKVSLPDGDDEFIGYIDLICSFKVSPGVRYVCDNKTSSRPYKEDSVRTSEQLAAYAESENNTKCAYIVLEKKLRKRHPRVRCNIIMDTIPETTINDTFDGITNVFHGIEAKEFEQNFDSCYNYGRKCQYYGYCRTKELANLKYLEKEGKNGNK
jgi:hypothetical protein